MTPLHQHYPELINTDIKNIILNNVDVKASLSGKVVSAGRINAYKSLSAVWPITPSGLSAIADSSGQINLTWADNSSNETGFKIERKTGTNGTYTQIKTVSANVTSYSDTGLTEGTTYYYRVSATNSAGDSAYTTSDSIPLDTTAPDTTITSQPTNPSNSTSASFSFTSTETGSTFQCQMDSGGYSACTSPKSYTGLTAGSHTFYVKATDSAGNIDSTPASYTWTIDTTAPDTSITSQPSSPSSSTSASFSFTSTETGSTFQCQMDSGGYSACTSPKSYTGLTAGSHTFYVKATDSAGNIDSTPASYTWTIDTTAPSSPAVSINSGASSTTSTSVTLTLSTTDTVGVTGYYASETSTTPSASATGWTSGTSTTSYSATVSFTLSGGSIGDNTKTVYVWFKDSVGNISASASDTITLTISDSTAPSSPSVSINNGDASTTSTSVTLSLSATDNAGVTAYYASETSTTPSATASGWTSGTSTTSYSASVSWTLSSGSGTKTVYVWFRDSAGNVSASSSDSITLVSAPSAPTGVTADAGNGQVSVSWTSVSDATSYNIYSSTTSVVTKLTGTKLTNGTSPYSHTGLTNGTTYYYVVTAVNSY